MSTEVFSLLHFKFSLNSSFFSQFLSNRFQILSIPSFSHFSLFYTSNPLSIVSLALFKSIFPFSNPLFSLLHTKFIINQAKNPFHASSNFSNSKSSHKSTKKPSAHYPRSLVSIKRSKALCVCAINPYKSSLKHHVIDIR